MQKSWHNSNWLSNRTEPLSTASRVGNQAGNCIGRQTQIWAHDPPKFTASFSGCRIEAKARGAWSYSVGLQDSSASRMGSGS